MSSKKDYYETLGVNKNASDDDIKKAYRNLAKKYHPDANPGDVTAEENFKAVSEAYSVLSDSEKKGAYDKFGHSAFDQSAGGGFSADFDMGDIFSSVFGDFFGGSSSRRRGPRRGMDLQTTLQLTFEEAFFGIEKDITLFMNEFCSSCNGSGAKEGTFPETCKTCKGTGVESIHQQTVFGTMVRQRTCTSCRGEGKVIKDPCTTCRGTGKVKKNKTLKVNIPKGVDNGQTLRLSGKGEPGESGAPLGDLLVNIYVGKHKLFVRDEDNIHLEVPITFPQAALGSEITIPTMNGEEKRTIKAGTQTGTNIVLKGKGFSNVQNNRYIGDLIVTLKVVVPTALNENQKQLLMNFDEEMGESYKNNEKWYKKIFK